MKADFCNFFPLRRGRTHEVHGAGSIFFASTVAQRIGTNILWVQESWRQEGINPWGIADIFDPALLLTAKPGTQTDVLAVAEEALRSGAVGLVIYHLNTPLTLTAGRRLQLAAASGKSTGLAIIQDGMGSNATETRWHCHPVFDETDSTLHRWEIIKNKSGTLGSWNVRWDWTSRSVALVPPAGDRSGPKGVCR